MHFLVSNRARMHQLPRLPYYELTYANESVQSHEPPYAAD